MKCPPSHHAWIPARLGLRLYWGVLLAVILAVIPVVSFATAERFPDVPEDAFTLVTRGPLEVVISQAGEVESARNVFLTNRCEWNTTLISLVPEGTWVEEGEIVAELDSSELQETLKERMIRFVNAESELNQAREDLQIQKLTNESQLADAQLQVRLTELQLDGYETAEFPQQMHELEREVAIAEETLSRARKQYRFVSEMVERGYRSRSDLESERIKLLRARQGLESAQDQLSLLTKHTYERTLKELQEQHTEAKRNLERVEMAARAALLSREVRLQARKRSFAIHKSNVERLQASIDACVIRATAAGEVVHGRASSSRSSKPLEEGDRVRFRQTIAKIPDRERLTVEVRLHESQIRMIEKGQPVGITVDAAADERYRGRISEVATVPLSGRFPNYHLKEYRVVVAIDAEGERARRLAPGMTANVNVVAARRQHAVQVPIHSVAEVSGRHVAFVRVGDNLEHREVEIGVVNDEAVEILSGLEEGEQVVHKPRVTCAQRLIALEHRYLTETAQAAAW
jgi:HlyD family secretion protein